LVLLGLQVEEKMRQLCAQLLRTENPDVIEEAAAQLHAVIDEYVATSKRQCPLHAVHHTVTES
jgi:hypothetical protein